MKVRATGAGLTQSGVLLAAFAAVVRLWSKTPSFSINLTLFNRLPMHAEVNDIIGDFTSLTLLGVEWTGAGRERFVERARAIQRQLWEDLDHRYVSGVRVMREAARGGGKG